MPKRHARRAVTRNLLRRQVRSAFERHGDALPRGLWLVRLREPYAKAQFISARSAALAAAVRAELDALLARLVQPRPAAGPSGPRGTGRPASPGPAAG